MRKHVSSAFLFSAILLIISACSEISPLKTNAVFINNKDGSGFVLKNTEGTVLDAFEDVKLYFENIKKRTPNQSTEKFNAYFLGNACIITDDLVVFQSNYDSGIDALQHWRSIRPAA
jgi:hypothetical protein